VIMDATFMGSGWWHNALILTLRRYHFGGNVGSKCRLHYQAAPFLLVSSRVAQLFPMMG
jgi:hypothetical protein